MGHGIEQGEYEQGRRQESKKLRDGGSFATRRESGMSEKVKGGVNGREKGNRKSTKGVST